VSKVLKMTALETREATDEERKGNIAFGIFQELVHRKKDIAFNMLRTGELFKKIKDEELYGFFDCDTFAEFYGMPELRYSRATVYLYMGIYELYIMQLGIKPEIISDIGIGELNVIHSVVNSNPEDVTDWLHKAKHLSRKDLRDEVRLKQGKEPLEIPGRSEVWETTPPPIVPDEYLEWVRKQRCCVCNAKKSDPHHFPRTRGAGGESVKNHAIPLCLKCHGEFHSNPLEFWHENKNNIMKYFWRIVFDRFTK